MIIPASSAAWSPSCCWTALGGGQARVGPHRAQAAGVRRRWCGMLAVARFARTLATLLKSGVPLLTALDIVKNVITNTVMAEVIDKARDAIREGESIASPLKRSGEFPPLVYHMVAIGERSGQLEDMLLNVADSYESQVDVRIGALTSLLEPMMIVVMGGVIAFVAFSILMPILQMNSMVH